MCFSEKCAQTLFGFIKIKCFSEVPLDLWSRELAQTKNISIVKKGSHALLSKHCNFYLCSILTFYIFKLIKHAAHPQQVGIIKPRSKMTFSWILQIFVTTPINLLE